MSTYKRLDRIGAMGKNWASSITPIIGNNVLTDGGFENWDDSHTLTNWTKNFAGASTLNQESVDKVSGNYAARIDIDQTSMGQIYGAATGFNAGIWGLFTVKSHSTPTGQNVIIGSSGFTSYPTPLLDAYSAVVSVIRSTNVADKPSLKRGSNGTYSLFFDDATLQFITFPSCLKTQRRTPTGDFIIKQNLRVVPGTQIGFCVNLDSAVNPQNFVLVYVDGTNARIDTCLAGVYTSYSVAQAWTDNDELKVVKTGISYTMYRNGTVIGVTQTISQANINNNTLHMQFSTFGGNVFSSPFLSSSLTGDIKRFSFIGDSITAAVQSFAVGVVSVYGSKNNIFINHAVSGAVIVHDGTHTDLEDEVLASVSDNADFSIIELGTNETDVSNTRSVYSAQINALKVSNPSASIHCMGVLNKTTPGNRDLINAQLALACSDSEVVYWDTEGWINPATDTIDGLHPNSNGHLKIATQVLARLP